MFDVLWWSVCLHSILLKLFENKRITIKKDFYFQTNKRYKLLGFSAKEFGGFTIYTRVSFSRSMPMAAALTQAIFKGTHAITRHENIDSKPRSSSIPESICDDKLQTFYLSYGYILNYLTTCQKHLVSFSLPGLYLQI